MTDPRYPEGADPRRPDSRGPRWPHLLAAVLAGLVLIGLPMPAAERLSAQDMPPPPPPAAAEPQPDEPSMAEPGPAEPPPAESGPAEPPMAEPGPAEPPPAESGPAEPPMAEPGPAAPPAEGPGPDGPPPAERAPGEAPPAERAPGEAPPAERAPGEKPPADVLPTPGSPLVLNFKDASLHTILEYLSAAAGLVVVQEAKVEGRVTVMSLQPVTVEEAVDLLDTILKEKGYAAVRSGRTLKIVTLAQAAKENLPVHSGNDPAQIPVADRLITQVIPIQFADAARLRTDLAPLLGTHATLSANVASNSLVLVDTQANVRRIVEIIRALDQSIAGVAEVKVFQLKYADATSTARLITEMFRRDQGTQGQQQQRFFPFGPGGMFGGGGPGGRGDRGERGERDGQDGIAGGRQQTVTASADARTNTVVVSAPPDLLKVIDGIVQELDSNPTEEQAVFIYPLKNAQAVKVEAVLNSLFGWTSQTPGRSSLMRQGQTTRQTSSPFGTSGRSTGGSSSGRMGSSGLGSSGFGSSGFGSGALGSSGFGGTSSSRFGSSFQTAGTGGFVGSGMRTPSAGTMASASDLAGQVFAVANEDTNSLLVTTASKNFDRVKEILADLDRPVPQVLIKILIAEVTHDNTLDLGAEFSVLNMRLSGFGNTVGTDFAVAAQTTGLTFRLTEADVTAAVRAIAGAAKLDVLSRPYILTSDNQEASIMVGQEVPFIRNTRTTETGQTINTIEYEDIGIIVSVIPHINPEGLVIMDVYPEISTLTGTTVPISETVSAPVFAKRSAQSRVAVPDGQTIVIGGLMEDRVTDNVQKVPILGDVPILGLLFQRKIQARTKTELLIFLTPHVAKQPGDLKGMSEDEQAGSKVIPQAVEPGAFQEHMRGMQRGAVPRPVPDEAPPDAPPGTGDPPPTKGAEDEPRP